MNFGIILAGGKGRRIGADKNKVLLSLGEKPILYHSVKAFKNIETLGKLFVVIAAGEETQVQAILADAGVLNAEVLIGGVERQDSVENGLDAVWEYVKKNSLELEKHYVLIHDSARPLVTETEILSVLEGAVEFSACTLGVLAKDTIKKADQNGFVHETLDRSLLWQITTPQGFRLDLLRTAYEAARGDGFMGTDDCSLVERIGQPIKLLHGSYQNIKITTVEDLVIGEALLKERESFKGA